MDDIINKSLFSLKKETTIFKCFILGIFLGASIYFFPYLLPFLVLTAFILLSINLVASAEVVPFLRRLFIINLSLRAALLFVTFFTFFILGKNGWLFGDEWGISERAWRIAQFLKGAKDMWTEYPLGGWTLASSVGLKPELLSLRQYGVSSYTYWVAFWYFLYGYTPLLPKLLNVVIGSCLGIIGYFLTREIFNIKTARLAAILISFFPTMLLWSILNLKDTAFIFLSMISIFALVRFYKTKSYYYFFFTLNNTYYRNIIWKLGV